MPRYFFNTVDGHVDFDGVGKELPDVAAVRDFAVSYAGSIVSDEPGLVGSPNGFRVNVVDQDRNPVLTVLTVVLDPLDAETAGDQHTPRLR